MAITFRQHRLPNGLNVIAEIDPHAHTAAVGFFVKAGARDEDRPLMGVSHFLEHMMFKGTARRTAADVNREFDEMGANYNAFTSHEMTVYYSHVLPEFLSRSVDLIGDMLRPALREDDFNMEKNVILEEIGMYEDKPHWRLQDTLLEKYFGRHPLSYRVLGTTESIKSLSAPQMRGYFEHRYSPDNTTIAAAGRMDFDRLVADVDKIAGRWTPTRASRKYEDPRPQPGEHALADGKLTRQYIAFMCPGPSAQDPLRYAARVLSDVLGDSDGSRLYWALIDPGLADEAVFSFEPQDHTGAFMAFASCDPERTGQVEKILLETVDRFADKIDPAEVERAKNKLATSLTLHGERPAGRMNALGAGWTYLGEYTPLEVEMQRLMAVTIEDIRKVIGAKPFSPKTIVRLGPK